MAKTKLDPIEDAKRTADGRPLDPLEAPASAPAVLQAQMKMDNAFASERLAAETARASAQAQPPPPPDELAAQAALAQEPVKRQPRKLYRVQADLLIVHMGQHIRFKVGHEIDPVGYGGEEGIARLKQQGLKVEPFVEALSE